MKKKAYKKICCGEMDGFLIKRAVVGNKTVPMTNVKNLPWVSVKNM
jgi:hypothetical protein